MHGCRIPQPHLLLYRRSEVMAPALNATVVPLWFFGEITYQKRVVLLLLQSLRVAA